MGKNSAIGVLSFSVANRRRDFLLPSVAASASLVWQKPASLFDFDPTLLSCAKKRRVEPPAKKLPRGNPSKGFPLDSFGNKRAAALLRSREFQICSAYPVEQSSTYFGSTLFLACKYLLVCKKSDDFPAEQQIWKTCPPQGIFALQKSLRGGLRWGTGTSSQRAKPPRKEISRGNLLCAESGLPSLSYPSTREYSKVRRHAQLGTTVRTGQPGVPEGPRPSVSEGVQRKPFPRVSFGQFLRGGSTPRFFAQLRSVGSNNPTGRSLPD